MDPQFLIDSGRAELLVGRPPTISRNILFSSHEVSQYLRSTGKIVQRASLREIIAVGLGCIDLTMDEGDFPANRGKRATAQHELFTRFGSVFRRALDVAEEHNAQYVLLHSYSRTNAIEDTNRIELEEKLGFASSAGGVAILRVPKIRTYAVSTIAELYHCG